MYDSLLSSKQLYEDILGLLPLKPFNLPLDPFIMKLIPSTLPYHRSFILCFNQSLLPPTHVLEHLIQLILFVFEALLDRV